MIVFMTAVSSIHSQRLMLDITTDVTIQDISRHVVLQAYLRNFLRVPALETALTGAVKPIDSPGRLSHASWISGRCCAYICMTTYSWDALFTAKTLSLLHASVDIYMQVG